MPLNEPVLNLYPKTEYVNQRESIKEMMILVKTVDIARLSGISGISVNAEKWLIGMICNHGVAGSSPAAGTSNIVKTQPRGWVFSFLLGAIRRPAASTGAPRRWLLPLRILRKSHAALGRGKRRRQSGMH